jgi:hypothetical protein
VGKGHPATRLQRALTGCPTQAVYVIRRGFRWDTFPSLHPYTCRMTAPRYGGRLCLRYRTTKTVAIDTTM